MITALVAAFLAVYATGPAGLDDRMARKFRLSVPRAYAVKGAS